MAEAYEQEQDRWVSRRCGLEQRWVSEVLAGAPVGVQRAEWVVGGFGATWSPPSWARLAGD